MSIHDRAHREDHREQQSEQHDDLSAFARGAQPSPAHVHGTSPVISPPPWLGSCVCSSRIVAFALRPREPNPRIGSTLNLLEIETRHRIPGQLRSVG
jgi:hypothetical protein